MPEGDTIQLPPRHRAILKAVLARFADRIDRAAIFGSRALGRASAASDIDLVLYGSLDDREVARIWTLLHESSLPVSVDVVRYEGLDQGPFRRHVEAYAKPLFTREELLDANMAGAT